VNGYSPKKFAIADFFALNFISLARVGGHSPKSYAAYPQKVLKTPLFILFGDQYLTK